MECFLRLSIIIYIYIYMRTVMTVCVLTRRGCEIKEEEEIRKRFSSFNRERITRMVLRRSRI